MSEKISATLMSSDARMGSEDETTKLLQESDQAPDKILGTSAEDSLDYAVAPSSSAMVAASHPPPGTTPAVNGDGINLSDFSSGICDCCYGPAGCQTCLVSFFLPCVAHGIIADAASGGRGQTAPCLLYLGSQVLSTALNVASIFPWVLGSLARMKLRSKYGLEGSTVCDCCLHFFCHPCSMAQELRELHALRARAAMADEALPPPVGMALSGVSSTQEPQEYSNKRVQEPKRRDWAKDLAAAYL